MRTGMAFLISGLLVVGAAAPATAETFTVKVKGGNSFVSRYQPKQASWDADVILVLTDVGNWIALEKADVESVVSETETRGFGVRLTPNMLLLGYSANDAEEVQKSGNNTFSDILSRLDQMSNRSYDQQQFVNPSEAGQGGIPVGGMQSFSFFATSEGGGAAPSGGATPPPGDGGVQ